MHEHASEAKFDQLPAGQQHGYCHALNAIDKDPQSIKLSHLNHIDFASMEIVNIHEAKTRLSKLLQQVSQGQPFIIAKAGRPIAKVVAVTSPEPAQTRRLGFLTGEIEVPDDFDRMGEAEISERFGIGN